MESSSFNLSKVFLLLLAHLFLPHSGHPIPFNKVFGIGDHSVPHILHLHYILALVVIYSPKTSTLLLISFNSALNDSVVLVFLPIYYKIFNGIQFY
mgnify:CR=1 FL=1